MGPTLRVEPIRAGEKQRKVREAHPINAIGVRHAHAPGDKPRIRGRAPHPPGSLNKNSKGYLE